MNQHKKLAKLLTRKRGCTSVDICDALPSVSPHRRISDLKEQGWTILKRKGTGRLINYFGTPPKAYQ